MVQVKGREEGEKKRDRWSKRAVEEETERGWEGGRERGSAAAQPT